MMRNPHLMALAAALMMAARAAAMAAAPAEPNLCLAGGGWLQARVRGAIDADINWSNVEMSCEGGMRPNNKGVRVSIAGPLLRSGGQSGQVRDGTRLRFVFGIALQDAAPGVAQALPTNLTVIVEGQKQLFATLGDDKCAVEQFEVMPLLAGGAGNAHGNGRQRVHARGYCTGPATDLAGTSRVLVSTFEFTSHVNSGEEP